MTEQQTPVLDKAPAPVPAPPPVKSPEKKKKRRKALKNVVVALVVLAVLAGAAFLIWKFVFAEQKKEATGEPIYDMAMTGTIASTVRGGGSASAKDSASILLAAAGIVQDVFVEPGQVVNKDDPLYVITSAAAEEALANARESYQKQLDAMKKLNEDMAELQKSKGELTIVAPHAGKLTEVTDLRVGDPLPSSTKIAMLVDDTRLKLSLYYSYAYVDEISVGQSAQISIPATMGSREGTVEKINLVERITKEGGKVFEVVFVIKNPGTLTAEMTASAELADSAGNPIYPYEAGVFSYYQTTTISSKATGPVESMADLMNYANISEGQVLVVQGSGDIDEDIRAKQDQITEAQKTLDAAAQKVKEEEKNLENFSAVAPITGTVVTCALIPGQEVASGLSAITIADNTVMTVNINVDDRNRQYISEGMNINLTDGNGNMYMGVVESVAVQGNVENGVTVFPAKVRVDNPDGTLMGGYWLDYEFTAAQSQDCVLIPVQDVRYYTPEGAEAPQGVVYLQLQDGMEPPENVIDKTLLPADMQAEIPKDCVVVPVETGLSDDINVEIVSGLRDGDLVYNNTPSENGNYWGREASGSVKAG